MPKYLEPTTPDTLPLYIAGKLDALGCNPREEDLDPIRVLLYTHQEERVISDEELHEWKKMEKKILKQQDFYKKDTERLPLLFLCILPVLFCLRVSRSMLAAECPSNPLTLFDRWPLHLIVVVIYLFYFYGSELGLKQGTPTPVQPEVVENENEDDDDWEGSMTSTELQSRQKALLRRWEPIMKERVNRLKLSDWLVFARISIMIYFMVHMAVTLICHETKRSPPTGELILIFAEALCTLLIPMFHAFQFMTEAEASPSRKKMPHSNS